MLDTQGLSDAIYNLMTRMRQETEIKDRDIASFRRNNFRI